MYCVCCKSHRIILRSFDFKQYHTCLSCGFMSMPKKEGFDLKNTVSNHYQNIDPHDRVASSKQSFFRTTPDYLSSEIKTANRSILDVGCGFGYFLELASRSGWDAFGVEIVETAVQDAKKRVGEKNIFHGPLRQTSYADNSFDALTMWDILVMLENPFEDLSECYRIIKKGGKIGIRVRNVLFQKTIYHLYSPFSKITSKIHIKKPYVFHQNNFSPKSLYILLQRVGFRSIQISNSFLTKGDPYSHLQDKKITFIIKSVIYHASQFIFIVTKESLITGPSLLAWAEKK